MYAGFDLGGSQLKYGLLDRRLVVFHEGVSPSPKDKEGVVRLLSDCWEEMKAKAGSRIEAAGCGLPGLYDQQEKILTRSPHLSDLNGTPITADLEAFLDCPLVVDNEANLAAYGEFKAGAGRGVSSLVLITVGTGIGAGLILHGEIWRGAGFAGELGHIPVRPGGIPCPCGSRGCLETEVSAEAILRIYRKLSGETGPLTFSDVAQSASSGDLHATESFQQAGLRLGQGLTVVINLIHPEKILLGGGVMEASDLLLASAREEAARRSFPPSFRRTRIERAGLGNRAGFIGAALRAADLFDPAKDAGS
jgi:glucokinase